MIFKEIFFLLLMVKDEQLKTNKMVPILIVLETLFVILLVFSLLVLVMFERLGHCCL